MYKSSNLYHARLWFRCWVKHLSHCYVGMDSAKINSLLKLCPRYTAYSFFVILGIFFSFYCICVLYMLSLPLDHELQGTIPWLIHFCSLMIILTKKKICVSFYLYTLASISFNIPVTTTTLSNLKRLTLILIPSNI